MTQYQRPDHVARELEYLQCELGHLRYMLDDGSLNLAPLMARPGLNWMRRVYGERYAERYWRWLALAQSAAPAPAGTPPEGPSATPREVGEQSTRPAIYRGAPTATTAGASARPVMATVESPARATAPEQVVTAPPVPVRERMRTSWFSARAFFTDHAILILSYLGAFLLLVAAMLFELYGGQDLPGARFGAVLVTDALFGVAAWACMRRETLRIVGRTYTAIFALLTPLMLVAAEEFLGLSDQGIHPPIAVAAGGAACAVLYARLATGLRSTAYATLSLLAVLAGALGCAGIAGFGRWTGLEMMPVAVFYTVVAKADGEPWGRATRFGRAADVLAYVVSAGAIVAAAVTASLGDFNTLAPEVPCVLAAAALVHTVAFSLGHRVVDAVSALGTGGAAVVAASQTLGTGYDGAALTLAGLGLFVMASTPRLLPGLSTTRQPFALWLRDASRVVSAVLLITSACLPVPDAWTQVTVIVAAVTGGLILAIESGTDAWLLVGLIALAGQVVATAVQPGGFGAGAIPRFPFIPLGLSALTAATAFIAVRARSSVLFLAVAAGISSTTLTACASLGASSDGIGWGLVGLGAMGALAARLWRWAMVRSTKRGEETPHLLALRAASVLHVVSAAGLVLGPDAASIGLLLVTVAIGFELAMSTRQVWWLASGVAALGLQICVLAGGANGFGTTGEVPSLAQIPTTLAALTMATAAFAYRTRRENAVVAVSLGVAATIVTADHTLAAPFWLAAAEFVPLALVGALVARRFSSATAFSLRAIAAAELVGAGGLVWHPDAAAVALLAGIVAAASVLAASTRNAAWLLAGLGALGTQLTALAAAGDLSVSGHAPVLLVVPCTLGALTVALLVVERSWSRQGVRGLLVPPMVLTTALAATLTAQADVDAYGGVLAGLAVLGTALSTCVTGLPRRIVIPATVTLEALTAASLPIFPEAMRIAVLAGAAFIAVILAVRDRRPEWLSLGIVALVAQTITVAAVDGTIPAAPFIPATLLLLTVGTATCAVVLRRTDLVTVVKVGVTLTVLTGERTFHMGADAYAVALVVLGWGYVLCSFAPIGRRQQVVTRIGGLVHVIACSVIATSPAELSGGLFIAAAAAVLVVAVAEAQPALEMLAAALVAGGWYWLVTLPAGFADTPVLVTRSYIALAPLFLAVGAAVRITVGVSRGLRWALAWYASGILVAIGVILNATATGDSVALGTMLIVEGAAFYGVAFLERRRGESRIVAAIGCFALPSGIAVELIAAGAAPEWIAVTFSTAAAVFALTRIPIRYLGRQALREWDSVHSLSALVAASVGLVAAASVPSVVQPHSIASLVAFGSTILFAALMCVEARLRKLRILDYIALVVAGYAPLWLALYGGLSNPQAYVVTPGLAILFTGLVIDRDVVPGVNRVWARAAVATGCGVLLGTSGLQALGLLSGDANDIFLLLGEALIAVLGGISLGNRALVVAGSAGILAAAIRALQEIVAAVPLYGVFGGAALVLLSVAWGLTVARDRWSHLRQELAGSWEEWR